MCLTFDQVLAAISAEPILANLGQDTIMIADKPMTPIAHQGARRHRQHSRHDPT
jgi:hypothetical protein